MGTLETKTAIAGAILCIVGLSLFAYGWGSLSNASALPNTYIAILGIFTGMVGMLVLMMGLFGHMR